MENTKITMLRTDRLFPHPNNPRKDLGDLTELAESIKLQGILQNLTVVPIEKGTYQYDCAKIYALEQLYAYYQKERTQEVKDMIERVKSGEEEITGYTVIIGHRRLAAAQLAGLRQVPCVITDMDEKTQLGTMLLENIQRNDLTVYEQAQGFQMMLDLGESVNTIAETTGFSKSTIRRRTKLLELNNEQFKQAQERGATLMDFDALNKVEDLKKRNELLKYLGTPEFDWYLKRALSEEENNRNREKILGTLDEYARNITKAEAKDLRYVKYISCSSPECYVPDDLDKHDYYYTDGGIGFDLYTDKSPETSQNEAAREEKRRKDDKKRTAIAELNSRAYKMRRDFICGISTIPETAQGYVMAMACKLISKYGNSIGNTVYCDVSNIPYGEVRINYSHNTDLPTIAEVIEKQLDDINGCSPYPYPSREVMRLLAKVVYAVIDRDYTLHSPNMYDIHYREDEDLKAAYEYVTKLGYQMAAEERALVDGTHEVYSMMEEEN